MKGNQKAEEILYDRYKIIVNDYLKSKYPKNYDIDDDISEIMIKVIMNLNKFDINKSKFKTWVITIANNHMIDKWRTNTITITGNNTNYTYTIGDSTINLTNCDNISTTNSGTFNESNISTNYCSADYDFENCSSINYISTQLSPEDYTLLDMKYIQGYNYNEIGGEFNLTSSTVSNRVNYIKSKLKKDNTEIIFE